MRNDASRRAFDFAISLVLLVLLFPLFFLIALLLFCTSSSTIFHRDIRVGWHNTTFIMYKFRTMRVGSHESRRDLLVRYAQDGHALNLAHDPRVTKLGYYLRRTSLDELPQLFNVLKGDMALVGPRPLLTEDIANAPNSAEHWVKLRASVRPGVTGAWQVSSRRDPNLPYEVMVETDCRYVEERSWKVDLKILLQSLPAVFQGHGSV